MRRLEVDARLLGAAVLAVTAGFLVHAVTRPEPRLERADLIAPWGAFAPKPASAEAPVCK